MRNNYIGQRLHYLRKQSGQTMRELGSKIGFKAEAADVRISQYERGYRLPKKDILDKLAEALNCEPEAILPPDCDSITGIMHLFFYLEERYGFEPYISNDGKIGITICPNLNEGIYGCCLKSAIYSWWIATAGIKQNMLTEQDYQKWKNNFTHINLYDLMPELMRRMDEQELQHPNPIEVDSRICAQARLYP